MPPTDLKGPFSPLYGRYGLFFLPFDNVSRGEMRQEIPRQLAPFIRRDNPAA